MAHPATAARRALDDPGAPPLTRGGGGGRVTRRLAARIAGIAYLVIGVAAMFANSMVLLRLVDPTDAAATAANIAASEGLFRAGLAAFVVVAVLDLVIAWALHVWFRPVHRDLSLLAAWLRMAYAGMLGVALLFLLIAVQVAGSVGRPAFDAGQRATQAALMINAFHAGWLLGLVFFGAHLLVLGWLALRSGRVPRLLGVLLLLAGVGYTVDGFAHVLLASYEDYAALLLPLVAVPSVVGEVGFAVWLLARGARPRHTTPAVAT